jgi:hypothetical protein
MMRIRIHSNSEPHDEELEEGGGEMVADGVRVADIQTALLSPGPGTGVPSD